MINELVSLHKECFAEKAWTAQDFTDLKKSGCEIIASENGFLVWRTVADETEIITLGVRPIARGTGIGDALLGLLEQEIGDGKIFLEVSADNKAAIKLYERNGYKEIGKRKNYYGGKTDAIVMEKLVTVH